MRSRSGRHRSGGLATARRLVVMGVVLIVAGAFAVALRSLGEGSEVSVLATSQSIHSPHTTSAPSRTPAPSSSPTPSPTRTTVLDALLDLFGN